jgi:uncharacterized protein (TIGR02246 family)
MVIRLIPCILLAMTILLARVSEAASEDDLVRAIPQRIVDGWNRGDGNAVASVYADDGVLVAGHGVVKRGRTQIAKYHEALFATTIKGTTLTVEVTSVRFLDPETVILQTEGGILWPGETSLASGNRGIQSFVAVKQESEWRIVLFQNTRIAPESAR